LLRLAFAIRIGLERCISPLLDSSVLVDGGVVEEASLFDQEASHGEGILTAMDQTFLIFRIGTKEQPQE